MVNLIELCLSSLTKNMILITRFARNIFFSSENINWKTCLLVIKMPLARISRLVFAHSNDFWFNLIKALPFSFDLDGKCGWMEYGCCSFPSPVAKKRLRKSVPGPFLSWKDIRTLVRTALHEEYMPGTLVRTALHEEYGPGTLVPTAFHEEYMPGTFVPTAFHEEYVPGTFVPTAFHGEYRLGTFVRVRILMDH